MEDKNFIKLRYCFQGGYTLPQYCIDNGINKPLIVMEKNDEWFLRELQAQFKFDNRLSARFCFIDGDKTPLKLDLIQKTVGLPIQIKHISDVWIHCYDTAIFLTKEDYDTGEIKRVRFSELENFFVRQTYLDIPLLNFLQRNPGVKLFLTNFPNNLKRYEGGAEFYSKIWTQKELQKTLKNNVNHVETPFDRLGYTNEEAFAMASFDKAKKNIDGTTSLIDNNHPLINIRNGRRVTAYQPEIYRNKIYFFGPCYQFGRNAPYDKTIESYLQKMLNEQNLPYCVENYGQAFTGRVQDMFYNLNALKFLPGDIVFFNDWGMHSNSDSIPFFDISNAFDPPHDYKEIFCDKFHVNEIGYKLVAEKYFKFLTENNFFLDVEFNYHNTPPLSQIWYTFLGRTRRRRKFCRQRGIGNLQTAT